MATSRFLTHGRSALSSATVSTSRPSSYWYVFAAPRYLATRGRPTNIHDLAKHEGLWPTMVGRRTYASGSPPPAAVECDDFGALLELARSGAGVAVLPLFLAARDVAEGALARVVPGHALDAAPLYLVTVAERPLPPRVAAFRDFLIDRLPAALATMR